MVVAGDSSTQLTSFGGLVFIFNMVVGVGALALPLAFSKSGLILGSIFLCFLAFCAYIAATFVVEGRSFACSLFTSCLLFSFFSNRFEIFVSSFLPFRLHSPLWSLVFLLSQRYRLVISFYCLRSNRISKFLSPSQYLSLLLLLIAHLHPAVRHSIEWKCERGRGGVRGKRVLWVREADRLELQQQNVSSCSWSCVWWWFASPAAPSFNRAVVRSSYWGSWKRVSGESQSCEKLTDLCVSLLLSRDLFFQCRVAMYAWLCFSSLVFS